MKKKYDIAYNWLISEIERLSSSVAAEAFEAALGDADKAIFNTQAEQLRVLGPELATARDTRADFAKWDQLDRQIYLFSQTFPTFPDTSFSKIRLSILLAGAVVRSSLPIDDVDVDDSVFEVVALTGPLPQAWFLKENATSPSNSAVVFSGSNVPAFILNTVEASHVDKHGAVILSLPTHLPRGAPKEKAAHGLS